ncbi:MAG: DMT family transporter [Candidatus Thorarchaeota archaeon]|nr:MAG: DMT family transporter [Candidatus Thorarchaeota archaeon]
MTYYSALCLAMMFWGGSWVSAKILVTMAPPMTIGFFRFLVASLLFVPLMIGQRTEWRRFFQKSNIVLMLLLGLTGIFGYGVLFLNGLRFTTSAQGAIIAGISPATVSLFAHLFHKERLGRRVYYSGFVISFVGVMFVIGVQSLIDFQFSHLIGNLILVAAMVLWGLYSSLAKLTTERLSATEAAFGGFTFGALFFGVGSLFEGFWQSPFILDPTFWINILYIGVLATFAAFMIYFKSLEFLGATRTGGFINLVPVSGTLFAVVILTESMYWTFMIGLVFVVTGIYILNRPDPRMQESPGNGGQSMTIRTLTAFHGEVGCLLEESTKTVLETCRECSSK